MIDESGPPEYPIDVFIVGSTKGKHIAIEKHIAIPPEVLRDGDDFNFIFDEVVRYGKTQSPGLKVYVKGNPLIVSEDQEKRLRSLSRTQRQEFLDRLGMKQHVLVDAKELSEIKLTIADPSRATSNTRKVKTVKYYAVDRATSDMSRKELWADPVYAGTGFPNYPSAITEK